jgi:7-cyano-7-deazaguanine synthase in queuosine biosynthesis
VTLLLWSGGCDSTLVLWNLLQDQSPSSQPIRTLAILHPSLGANEEQSAARAAILARLAERSFRVCHTDVSISQAGSAYPTCHGGIIQPIVWLSIAIPYLLDEDDLYTGWVRGDDVWHHKTEVRWIFDYSTQMLNKRGKLQYPLEYTHKSEVIDLLRRAKLMDLVWWCESPVQSKPCGLCGSCVTHAEALARGRWTKKQAKVRL